MKHKILARPPVMSLDSIEAAELGFALELELHEHIVKFPKGKHPLLWWPESKSLLIYDGIRRGRKGRDVAHGEATRAFEMWAGRDAKHERTDTMPVRGKWRAYGAVLRIDYASDKWTRKDEYTHTFGPGVRLYRYGGAKVPPWLWVLKGGEMTVTERGIEQ